MAIVKKPNIIRQRFDERINYATTGKKTKLNDRLEYVMDHAKTQGPEKIFTSFVNCSENTPFQDMMDTKLLHCSEEGIQGYSFIQSFKPGELTPEQAHEIGKRLAQEYFGDRYEVVIGTHLDKAHLHNHIIVNSVSFIDGKKYDNKLYRLEELRTLSDRLCQEFGLSILPPSQDAHTLTHKEWHEQKQGIPSRNDMLRKDIDAAIAASFSFHEFVTNMGKMGYRVHYGPNVKYMTVTPPGADGMRARRVYRLGEEYFESAIRQRLDRNKERQPLAALLASTRRRRAGNAFPHYVPTKLSGIRALYYKYLYQLGAIRKRPYTSNRRTAYLLRNEIGQMDRYVEQFRLLNKNGISSIQGLNAYRSETELKIEALLGQREALYRKRRAAIGKSALPTLQAQCDAITAQLKPLRAQVRYCKEIEERSVHIAHQQALLRQEKPVTERIISKQEKQYER